MQKIYYATTNWMKYQEAKEYFKNDLFILDQYKIDTDEKQTLEQEQIAIDKARQAWEQIKQPVLAEDAGIYFEKYNEFPGTLTKYIYKAIGMEGIFKLVNPGDKAYFQLALVYYYGPDQYQVFKGISKGTITKPKQFLADLAFVYDDIFVPEGADKSHIQLRETGELYKHNYRISAFEKFVEWYKKDMLIKY